MCFTIFVITLFFGMRVGYACGKYMCCMVPGSVYCLTELAIVYLGHVFFRCTLYTEGVCM